MNKQRLVVMVSWVAVVAAAAVFVVAAFSRNNDFPQPIAFNHQKHIQNNVKCAVCHQYYANHAAAGLPGVDVCIKCHEDVIYLTPEKEKIQKYYSDGKEIPWKQIYSVPTHVYFSHKRHVTFGKIGCIECHGDVTRWTSPPTEPEINLTMDRCITCHQEMQKEPNLAGTYNCNRCHR